MHPTGIVQRGFTLIELSIVLVIIGLIVGGVLVGQDMIRAAAARATISQIEKYNTAVNTSLGKYGCLPGDCANAAQYGFIARGQYAGEGDGNGVIEGIVSNAAAQNEGDYEGTGETATFWVDLSADHLIEGGFNAATETTIPSPITQTSSPSIDAYLPQAKLGKGNYIYVYSYQSINYYGLSAVNVISSSTIHSPLGSFGSLTVQEAYNIDKKADDGMPLTGNIVAQFLNCCGSANLPGSTTLTYGGFGQSAAQQNWPHTWTCYDNDGVAGVQPTYSLSQNSGAGVNCALSFQFQ